MSMFILKAGLVLVLGLLMVRSALLVHPKPAPAQAVRIMPLGDSITYGVDDRTHDSPSGGYRNILLRELPNVIMVGSVKDSATNSVLDNEGHRAWTIRQMNEQATTWCKSANPDIVLVHAGTNDLAREVGPNMAAIRLRGFIQTLLNSSHAKIYVASLVPILPKNSANADAERFTIFDRLIPGVVASFASTGRVSFVDMTAEKWSASDYGSTGVHLRPSGYAKMAHAWEVSLCR